MIEIPVYKIGEAFTRGLQLATRVDTGGVITYPGKALTDYTDILIFIYSKSEHKELIRFSMNAKTGYNNTDFKIVSSGDGTFKLVFKSAITALGVEDRYVAEVWAYEVDTDYTTVDKPIVFSKVLFGLETTYGSLR